jgi:hypothetical protein
MLATGILFCTSLKHGERATAVSVLPATSASSTASLQVLHPAADTNAVLPRHSHASHAPHCCCCVVLQVYGIDVGHGQVMGSIAQDPRVTVMEKTNLRHMAAGDLPKQVRLC